jgi:hypothetical protein
MERRPDPYGILCLKVATSYTFGVPFARPLTCSLRRYRVVTPTVGGALRACPPVRLNRLITAGGDYVSGSPRRA